MIKFTYSVCELPYYLVLKMGQFVYLGGRYDDKYLKDILEFDPVNGQWKLVDQMILARGMHAVSVIDFEPGLCV